jgi:adenylyl-sulfate reductase (glutathione)
LQIGSLRILERNVSSGGALNLPQRRSLVKAINAESQRNDSIVPLAATIVAPGAFNCFILWVLL